MRRTQSSPVAKLGSLYSHRTAKRRHAGVKIIHHDLYAEIFDPRLTAEDAYSIGNQLEETLARATDPKVREYRLEIASADGLLIVHPNWWGKPPAILAGWIDRVLVPGTLPIDYRPQPDCRRGSCP